MQDKNFGKEEGWTDVTDVGKELIKKHKMAQMHMQINPHCLDNTTFHNQNKQIYSEIRENYGRQTINQTLPNKFKNHEKTGSVTTNDLNQSNLNLINNYNIQTNIGFTQNNGITQSLHQNQIYRRKILNQQNFDQKPQLVGKNIKGQTSFNLKRNNYLQGLYGANNFSAIGAPNLTQRLKAYKNHEDFFFEKSRESLLRMLIKERQEYFKSKKLWMHFDYCLCNGSIRKIFFNQGQHETRLFDKKKCICKSIYSIKKKKQ